MVKQIWKKICTVEFYKACNGENKNTMTGLANCRKTNKHYAHLSLCAKSRKNNNAKLRKWPKSSISAIFWWFPGQISLSCKLFWKKVSLKLKVIFSINVKPKTKKILEPFLRKISVPDFGLIWRPFCKYLQITNCFQKSCSVTFLPL